MLCAISVTLITEVKRRRHRWVFTFFMRPILGLVQNTYIKNISPIEYIACIQQERRLNNDGPDAVHKNRGEPFTFTRRWQCSGPLLIKPAVVDKKREFELARCAIHGNLICLHTAGIGGGFASYRRTQARRVYTAD